MGEHPAISRPAGRDPNALKAVVRKLLADERYAFVLLNEAVDDVDEADAHDAWQLLQKSMALVPAGIMNVVQADGYAVATEVAAFYLDRHAVTNAQYLKFVQSGSYEALEMWPREVWPALMGFVDATGKPGPQHWENGGFPARLADHPVVGICWHEALAYARWIGKRLPTASEWQKASGGPDHAAGAMPNRYPWGGFFAEGKANLWSASLGQTAPVQAFREGSTLNGIHQMTGNVWEWLGDPLEMIPGYADAIFRPVKPMRRIIGGAYNTYLPAEATNHYVTGQGEIDRRPNIGFRCAVSTDRLRPAITLARTGSELD